MLRNLLYLILAIAIAVPVLADKTKPEKTADSTKTKKEVKTEKMADSTETKKEVKTEKMADSTETKKEVKTDSTAKKPEIKYVTTESGLRYVDLVVGEGVIAVKGMKVSMHYTLWFNDHDKKGEKIQSSLDINKPLDFTVGMEGLISGWNEGAEGMKEGGTRRLMIPAKLAYGTRGRGKMIPPNTDLIFELIFIKQVK